MDDLAATIGDLISVGEEILGNLTRPGPLNLDVHGLLERRNEAFEKFRQVLEAFDAPSHVAETERELLERIVEQNERIADALRGRQRDLREQVQKVMVAQKLARMSVAKPSGHMIDIES
ncbi:hypothetical protein [Alicyclobacillus acidiphilus]|uniref:hypothetical protein n=1 Tax=Alicyclobacillus acidiphilus TaxID=182455 RepID=UPI000833DA64|nr:hypothetical protein [Alicyclobacillus acidiphilus]